VETHSTPLVDVTTTFARGLKAYSTAMKVSLASAPGRGIPFLRRAVEIDPNFAMAMPTWGLPTAVGESVLAAESATKAWQLRERAASGKVLYHLQLRSRGHGNLEHAFQTLELWEQTYPRRAAPPDPLELLGGLSTKGTGRWEMRRIARKTIALSGRVHRIWESGSLEFLGRPLRRGRERPPASRRAQKEWLELPQFLVYDTTSRS
jgi:hypothetical protein